MKIFKLIKLMIFSFYFVGSSFASDNSIPVKETEWTKTSEFKTVFHQMKENRFMPYKIIGKYEHEGIFYKGYYMPYPPNMEYFYAVWGKNYKWYKKRKGELELKGFEEIWHQSYQDAIGTEIHQAIWLKLDKSQPEKEDSQNSEDKKDIPLRKKTGV